MFFVSLIGCVKGSFKHFVIGENIKICHQGQPLVGEAIFWI